MTAKTVQEKVAVLVADYHAAEQARMDAVAAESEAASNRSAAEKASRKAHDALYAALPGRGLAVIVNGRGYFQTGDYGDARIAWVQIHSEESTP